MSQPITITPAQGWPYEQMKAVHRTGAATWIEVTEDFYHDMLNVLPPLDWTGARFLVGEPYCHNSEGRGIYAGLVRTHGRFFARYSTRKDFAAMHGALCEHLNALPATA